MCEKERKPIRILHIVTYMGRGGLETMLMNYYRHMDRSKVQFDFLVHRDFEADYDREILAMGGKIFQVSKLIPWSRSYRNELKDFFRKHPEYTIVHVHQDCLSSVALQCAAECGVPVRIAHSHSSSAVKDLKYPIKLHYMKRISKYATHLFSCGKQAGDWMFCGAKHEIIRNAIDTAKYDYSVNMAKQKKEELGLQDCTIIGHVGNFTIAKNHLFLLDVFAEILKIDLNARLLLVGGGDRREEIETKAKQLGIKQQITFAGVRTDVNELMQAMDVFVFPSLYEGIPVTMIEAQAAGLHCVISDHVSEECIVTSNLVIVKKLSDPAKEWAEHILKQSKHLRKSVRSEIETAGYGIMTAAKKLQEFYLNKYGE